MSMQDVKADLLRNQLKNWENELKEKYAYNEYEILPETWKMGRVFKRFDGEEVIILYNDIELSSGYVKHDVEIQYLTGERKGDRIRLPFHYFMDMEEHVKTINLTKKVMRQLDIENQLYRIKESKEKIQWEQSKIEKAEQRLKELRYDK